MAKMNKLAGYYEDAQGVEHGPFRIGLQDKLQYEKTAKARNWDAESDSITSDVFLVWHASKRAGAHDLSFTDFTEQMVDAAAQKLEDEETEEAPLSAGNDF